jgi:hypothetical protein
MLFLLNPLRSSLLILFYLGSEQAMLAVFWWLTLQCQGLNPGLVMLGKHSIT